MVHTDQKYIDALCNNDSKLINDIYKNHTGKIKKMVLQNSGTEDEAADLFQDALIDIYNKAKKGDFELTCPFEGFLYIICKNKWLNILKKNKNQGVTNISDSGYEISEDSFKNANIIFEENEKQMLLNEKINQLQIGCRQILDLNWQGLSMEVVAEKLNFTYAYVRKKKSECMAKLISLVKTSPEYKILLK